MRHVQVVVVGGGPAGLSAAITAATSGVQVALLDEHASLGGQLRYRVRDGARDLANLRESLMSNARDAGVELVAGAKVWGLFNNRVLGVAHGAESFQLQADQIVLATGSTDRGAPFAGGSLPGVMTTRALQILLHCHRVSPGKDYAIVGTGAEAVEVARDIERAGGRIVIFVDPALRDPSLAAEGAAGVASVTVGGVRYDVDIIVIAVGRQPDAELAMMVECSCGYDPALGGIAPFRDELFQTSVGGVLVAGDAAGVCDLSVALTEGAQAGLSAASLIGLVSSNPTVVSGTPRNASMPVDIHV